MRVLRLAARLVVLLAVAPATSGAETRAPAPPTHPVSTLPDSVLLHRLAARIDSADRVSAYRFLADDEGDCGASESVGCFRGHPVVRRWEVPPAGWRDRLSSLLKDPESFTGSEKLCICQEDFALRFEGRRGDLDLLFCFDCNTITLISGATTVSGFMDTIGNQVRQIIAAVLPEDMRFSNGVLVGPSVPRADDFPGSRASKTYESPPILEWEDEALKRSRVVSGERLLSVRLLVGQDGRVKAVKSADDRHLVTVRGLPGMSMVFKPALRAKRPVWAWIDMQLPLAWKPSRQDSVVLALETAPDH